MTFEPLDGIKLVLLMAAGLIFAVAGLYLLIRPKPEGNAAKIEIFGLKFESSSAGLLVFLIGAGFLAVPMFVPEKKVEISRPGTSPAASADDVAEAPQPVPDEPKRTPVPVAATGPKVAEVEPNNVVEKATPLAIGQTASGQTGADGDIDWFVVPVPPTGLKGHEVKLKHFNTNGNRLTAQVFNNREENMGYLQAKDGAVYLPIKSEFVEKMYFRVFGYDRDERGYEISLVPGPDD